MKSLNTAQCIGLLSNIFSKLTIKVKNKFCFCLFIVSFFLLPQILDAQCATCTGNLIVNGGFNTNTTGWTSSNGAFAADNPYPQCGTAKNAVIQRNVTTGTTQFYQDVSGLTGGSTVELTFWAGVHVNSYDTQFGMEFYNGSSTTLISQSKQQIDYILGGSPSMQFYTINVTLPATATRIRLIGTTLGSTTNNWLKVDEICLNVNSPCANFKSLVTADANLVKTRTVTNEVNCNGGSPDRVFWLECILDNSSGGTSGDLKYWKIISGGTFKEYCDGTATLTMRVQNVVNSNYKFDISIIFTGRTYTAPAGNPHLEGCTSAATTNWYYYTTTNGTMTGVDGLSGALLSFTRKGGAFQLGTNASLYGTTGAFGASGWLMYDIITQPSAFNLSGACGGDINFFLSGGNLTSTQASDCGNACALSSVLLTANAVGGKPAYTYNWSNGLGTGQTKTVNPSATTNYTVTVTDVLGCTSTDVVTITVVDCCTQFNPTITGSNGICADNIVPTALTASGGGTYIWSTGQTTASINVAPNTTTTYSVTVTSTDGCVKSATKTVSVIPCEGEICFFGNSNVGATAKWVITYALDPANDKVKIRATLSKNFVDNTYGTGSIGWGNLTTHTFSKLVGSDHLQISLLDANNVKKLEFKMDYITASTAAPSGYKSLGVTGGDGSMIVGGSSDVLSVITSLDVNFNQYGYVLTTNSPATNSSYAPNPTYPNWIFDVWYETEVKLSAFGTAGFGKVGITGVHASPSKTGNNTEVVTEGPCCEMVVTLGNDSFVCSGGNVTMTPTITNGIAPYTYAWSTGQTTGTISVTANTTTTYSVTVTDKNGCTDTASKIVTVYQPPVLSAGEDLEVCKGTPSFIISVSASGGKSPYTYSWPNGGTGNSQMVSPTVNTTYVITVTDANGCQDTDDIYVTIIPGPTVNVGPDINLCTADEELINSIVTDIPICGSTGINDCNHILQGTTGWIESGASAAVCGDNAGAKLWTKSSTSNPASSLTLDFGAVVPAGTVICVRMKLEHCSNTTSSLSDAKIQRSLSSGSGYTDVITSKTFSTQTYTEYCYTLGADTRYVKIIDNGKCAFRVDYVKYQTPDTYNNTIEYLWTGPGIVGSTTGPSIIVNKGGTYVLVVTDCGGCTASDAVNVNINGDVNADAGPDKIICNGTSATLTAATVPGASYEWRTTDSPAIISMDQAITVSPTQNTTYILKVIKNGCEDSDAVEVTVNARPSIGATATPTSVCVNGTSILNATASGGTSPYTFNWSNALGSGAQKSVNPLVNTTYSVTVSDVNGCTANTSVSVLVNQSPSLTVTAAPDVICKNESSTLTASATGGSSPYSYNWSDGLGVGSSKIVTPLANKTYNVTVTDGNGCSATGNVQVTVKSSPDNSGITGPDEVCADEFAIFTANPPIAGATYFWDFNGGITTDGDNDDLSETVSWPSIFKNTFRTVTLTITKDNCPFTYTKQVFVKQGPFLNTPGGYDVCQGGTVQIGPNPNDPNQVTPGSTFLWTPNLFLNNNTVARPVSNPPFNIVYTLTATINGCVETKQVTVNVDVNLNPIADAGPDKSICLGSPIQIGGNPTATPPPGGAIQGVVWIPAAGLNNPLLHNPTANPAINTQYQVVVVATSGCADTATMNLTVLPKPSITLTANPTEICSGTSAVLTATPSGGTQPYSIQWSNALGAGTTKTVSPIINTSYMVTVTDFLGCTGTASVTVLVNPRPTVNVTATPTTICVGESSTIQAIGNGGTTPYSFEWSNGLGSGSSKIVTPSINTTYTVTITDSKGCTNTKIVTITVEPKAKVGDYVWHDTNGDGKQDVGEPGLNDVTVTLYNALTNNQVATTTTVSKGEEDGYYEFEVCKGTYYIIFGGVPTYVRTLSNAPSDDTKDSDADATTGRTSDFVLNPGDNNPTVDAGYYKLASIGDFVWFDANANGIQDMGEIGVSGIQVNLTGIANDGTPVNTSQPTNGSGLYLFTNLKPGVYTVQVVKPVEYLFSPANVGGDDTKDSDSDPGTGIMSSETLTSGEDNRTYDAGLYPSIDLEIEKTFISAVQNFNGSFDVTYRIDVNNLGGPGLYDLTDNQGFDTDVIINSSSYTSTAPGNAGSPLAGSGTWILANDQQISGFGTHTYTLVVNVTLNLTDNVGNNTYTSCSGQTPTVGQGLYNKARVYVNDILKDQDDACGDIPNITLVKDFVSVTPKTDGSFDVVYKITVGNNGGATGTYSLKDTPQFDDDVVINSGSFSGQAIGPMNTSGSTTLATNVSLAAGSNHMYNVTFNVTLDLNPSSNQGGDNTYTKCEVPGNGPGSSQGHGLYNKAEVDRTGDGVTDLTDDACGDIPNITMVKDFESVTQLIDGRFNVKYKITVRNTGGASGDYNLKDSPLFDDDVTIEAWDYTFVDVNAGVGNGPSFIGSPTIPINLGTKTLTAGNTHIYTISFTIRLNLAPGSPDGGDNIYTKCEIPGNGPGSSPRHGLYNVAEVDKTGDGITDITDDACGDIPNITLVKDFVSVTPKTDGSFDVMYKITVGNNGGATGTYSLKDTPQFDDDVVINNGSFNGQASGPMSTSGSTTLATNISLAAGSNHMYNVTFNVSLDLNPSSNQGGDNVYRPCEVPGNGPGSSQGHGLYNKAEVDKTGDGVTDLTDDACGDIPNITLVKDFVSVTPKTDGSFDVVYKITVGNNGGATGTYSLKDTPQFDDDVVINSGSFNGQASGPMNTSGSTTLATNVSLAAGSNHMYNVTFNVTLDLNPSSNQGGDNVYTKCEVPGNGPGSSQGHGLFNKAEVDKTGDGITDLTDDACGDIPNITLVKDFVSVVNVEGGYYDVNYKITVANTGGATGFYSLSDEPLFDDDVQIISGLVTGQVVKVMNNIGSTTLATNVPILAGAMHMYNVTFRVFLDLQVNSGGDNIYTPCEVPGNGPGSSPRHGLYNLAKLDKTGDNIPDLEDDACGDLPKGSIGDFVWEDKNANGIQDPGEPGIFNVLVRLFNGSGTTQLASIQTGLNGEYLFSDLNPGVYLVKFPTGGVFIITEPDKGFDDAKDSDANKITGITPQIILAPGENNLTIDAGYYKLAKIGDFVWEDTNLNGIQDPLEPGLPGVTVKLTGTDGNGTPVSKMTTTSGIGLYEFGNLVPGNYIVEFVRPAPNVNGQKYISSPALQGLDNTKDSNADILSGKTGTIILNSGDNNMTIDAGFYRCAEVGDYIWYDGLLGVANNIQDAGDVGLNNVTVELYDQNNPLVVFMTQLTRNGPDGKAGYYLFTCVPPGTYKIRVRKPNPTYQFVTPNFGLDDNIDSDVTDFPNESTLNFTVTYAQIIHDIDIGFKSKPLPVDLSRFDGRWNQIKDVNELDWATLSEQNSDFFEVQRSFKGSRYFAIGQVKSAGNSNTLKVYNFVDDDISSNGIYSYRLRQVDIDGKETFTKVVNIIVDRVSDRSVVMYPNPATQMVTVELSANEGSKVAASIFDNTGKLVMGGIFDEVLQKSKNAYNIDINILKPGVYTLMVILDGDISTHKLIVIK